MVRSNVVISNFGKTHRAGSAVARVAVALAGAGVAGAILWSADVLTQWCPHAWWPSGCSPLSRYQHHDQAPGFKIGLVGRCATYQGDMMIVDW